MATNNMLFPLTFLLAFAVGIIGCVMIAYLWACLKANSVDAVKRAMVILVGLAIFTMFFTIYTYPGVISPGILLYLVSLVMTPVSIIAWLIMSIRFIQLSTENRQVQRWFWVSGLAVVFFFSSPLLARPIINQACRALTQSAATPLITAITEYRAEHGTLPNDLGQLIPHHLSDIPVPPCSFLTGYIVNDSYQIYGSVLTTNSADGFSCEDYNLDEHRWSIGYFDFIDYGPSCY
jgi:hypothetical protein